MTGPGSGDGGPYFFLSYERRAPQPGEQPRRSAAFVGEFFVDLVAAVRRKATGSHSVTGFCDLSIPVGEAWSEIVENELATCRVLVPLYSPRYFESELCGRELSAFLRRATGHVAPIVPVLWAPTAGYWPRVPAPYRVNEPDVDERYSADGLYGLMALREVDAEADRGYRALIAGLGTQIVTLAESTHIPSDLPLHLDDAPNAFAQARPTLGLYVLAPTRSRLPAGRSPDQYGETSPAWNPYRGEAPNGLQSRMAGLARNLGYEPKLTGFDEAEKELIGVDPPIGPGVLVIDPWALDDPEWRERLGEFDRTEKPWVGIVVAWDLADPETKAARPRLQQQVRETLHRRYASRPVALQLDASDPSSVNDFGRVLSVVVQESAMQYLRQAAPRADATRDTAGWPTPADSVDPNRPEASDGL